VSEAGGRNAAGGTVVAARMQVEIFSDVVCPWCYIGKRRFEAALASFPHRDDVNVTYRSFQLDPDAPVVSTQSVEQHLAAKYGRTLEQAREMNQRVTDLAAGVGLRFHLEKAQRANTFDAHRLLHLAAARGLQGELAERLLDAYFVNGAVVSDHAELTELAAAAGLDAAEAAGVLRGDDYAEQVRADLELATRFGISGVPFFVFDRTYGVSGAQETAVFDEVLERVWNEAQVTSG
jgi:predicted DsbA family dithiol-disulfide isomerase